MNYIPNKSFFTIEEDELECKFRLLEGKKSGESEFMRRQVLTCDFWSFSSRLIVKAMLSILEGDIDMHISDYVVLSQI